MSREKIKLLGHSLHTISLCGKITRRHFHSLVVVHRTRNVREKVVYRHLLKVNYKYRDGQDNQSI